MTPTSPLTPRPGYAITLSQTVGGKPLMRMACTACAWDPALELPDLDVANAEAIGRAVLEGVAYWLAHATANKHLAGAS